MASKAQPVIVVGRSDKGDPERIQAAEEAGTRLASTIGPGGQVEITIRKPGRYTMVTIEQDAEGYLDEAPVHVVVSLAFCRYLPHYRLTPVAKDVFWVMVGRLAETDPRGRYPHMHSNGEVAITQQQIADELSVSRMTVNGGLQLLTERAFVWKTTRRAVYQINPTILYFGSAEMQNQAVGYARAKRRDGELPRVPHPGQEFAVITPRGVKTVIA